MTGQRKESGSLRLVRVVRTVARTAARTARPGWESCWVMLTRHNSRLVTNTARPARLLDAAISSPAWLLLIFFPQLPAQLTKQRAYRLTLQGWNTKQNYNDDI